jgi:hypothetical protein
MEHVGKIIIFKSHLNFLPTNLCAVSDEHGERFHREIPTMKKRSQRQWSPNILAEYPWTLVRDAPEVMQALIFSSCISGDFNVQFILWCYYMFKLV